jgi:hypothetical protein
MSSSQSTSQHTSATLAFRESIKKNADTLAAALIVSDRIKARADAIRTLHRTSSRNDHDWEADIIDAMIVLVAQNGYQPTGESTPLSKLDNQLSSSHELRHRRLMR